MSGALDGGPAPRWAGVAAVGIAVTLSVDVVASSPAQAAGSATPTPTPSPAAVANTPLATAATSVSVTTTSTTSHAAGSSLPDWGLVFLIAVFVAAVAVALPVTRHRTRRETGNG